MDRCSAVHQLTASKHWSKLSQKITCWCPFPIPRITPEKWSLHISSQLCDTSTHGKPLTNNHELN